MSDEKPPAEAMMYPRRWASREELRRIYGENKMSDEKPSPKAIAARLRGMASDPYNALDMRLLVQAAEIIERDSDNRAMLEMLRELERIGDCPFCRATRGEGFHYHDFRSYSTPCPLGALLDKHGRSP